MWTPRWFLLAVAAAQEIELPSALVNTESAFLGPASDDAGGELIRAGKHTDVVDLVLRLGGAAS